MPCIGAGGGKRRLSTTLVNDEEGKHIHPAEHSRVANGRNKTASATGSEFRGSVIVELHRRESVDFGLAITGGADKDTAPRVAYLKPGSIAHRASSNEFGAVNFLRMRDVRYTLQNAASNATMRRSDALEVGDYITSVNGVRTMSMKHNEVVNLLQNSTVSPTVIEVEYSLPDPQQMSFSVLCKRIEIVLTRDAGGTFGMTLRGGASVDPGKCRPLSVTQIRPGGPADREGTLKIGDRILAVNGFSLIQRSLSQALHYLRDVPDDEIAFLVEYDVSVLEVVQNATGPLLVEIDKLPGNPLGITLAQGRYRGRTILFIDGVAPASIADRCGALHVGDHVLSVDGVLFDEGLPVTDAMSIVSACSGSQVQLEIVPAGLVRTNTESGGGPVASGPTKGSGMVAEEPSQFTGPMISAVTSSSSAHTQHIVSNYVSRDDPDHCAATQGRLFSSVSMNSLASSILSHDTCSSMKTQVGSAVAKYGCGPPGLGYKSDRSGYSSLDRGYTWDSSLGRRSTLSGNSMMVTCHQTAQVCHLDTSEVMLFADQHRRALGGAAAYGLIIDMPGVAAVQPQALLVQPPTISYIEPRGPSERCGVLQEGDHILAINGQYLEGRTVEEVEQFIAESPVKMLLLVEFRVAESIIPSSGVFVVKLAKRGAGLGITISCPRNRRPGQHLIISDVKKGSVAHRTGSIQPGDQLLAIDNVRLDNCTLEDSARVLQDTHDIVKLTIKKDENFADEPDPTHIITYTVELPKFAGPLGITISGSEEPFDPVFISSLTEDGLAQKTGALHVGDRLLAINGVSLRGKTLTDAVHLLQNAGDTVTLKITRPANGRARSVGASCNTTEGKCYDSMDSALESWDSSGLEGNNVKANQRSHLKEPHPSDGSSSNGSNNGSNTSANQMSGSKSNIASDITSNGVGQPVTSSTMGSTAQTDRQLRVTAPGGWDMGSVSVSASAPPSCGSGGSVDDEWSRQLDELDRLRPSTAEPMACGSGMSTGRSVIDFFTDLPDVIIDDEPILLDQLKKSNGMSTKLSLSTPNVSRVIEEPRDESGINDCDRMSALSDVTTADIHLREVEQQLENIFTPTPIELLKVTLRRPSEAADFGFSLSDGVFEKGVYISAIRPAGPAENALKPYDRVLQVNNVRTKDLDCCQVVPLIIQTVGNEIHLVISRNPLVWNHETHSIDFGGGIGCGRPRAVTSQANTCAIMTPHPQTALYDSNRGITR